LRTRIVYWLLLVAAASAVAFAPLPFPSRGGGKVRTFWIRASQFSYSPSELHVRPGDIVTINLESADVAHGLYVDGYGTSVEADPGQPASLTFVADRAGSFRFRCNITCGALHPFMIGKLTVGTDRAFYRGVGLALVGLVGLLIVARLPARVEKTG
jgi:heme/copper-type cytochrome/quinol oxidase subunit 2